MQKKVESSRKDRFAVIAFIVEIFRDENQWQACSPYGLVTTLWVNW